MNDDFYIGYQERAPRSVGRWSIAVSGLLLVLAVFTAVALDRSQNDFEDAQFEFGTVREYIGWLEAGPVPILIVADSNGRQEYLLVSQGKFGLPQHPWARESRGVRLKGTRIRRDDISMLEVVSGSVETDENLARPDGINATSLGIVTLHGQIVDSKCYLGVMNPGEKTVHRACARLCIAGGIPPMLVVRNRDNGATYLMLTGDDGHAVNQGILPWVAYPVIVTGEIFKKGSFLEMRLQMDGILLIKQETDPRAGSRYPHKSAPKTR